MFLKSILNSKEDSIKCIIGELLIESFYYRNLVKVNKRKLEQEDNDD